MDENCGDAARFVSSTWTTRDRAAARRVAAAEAALHARPAREVHAARLDGEQGRDHRRGWSTRPRGAARGCSRRAGGVRARRVRRRHRRRTVAACARRGCAAKGRAARQPGIRVDGARAAATIPRAGSRSSTPETPSYRFALDTTSRTAARAACASRTSVPSRTARSRSRSNAKPYAGKVARLTGWLRTRDARTGAG